MSRYPLYIALGVAAIFTVMAFFVFGIGGFMRSTANYRGGTEKKERVEANGDYRVAQHDYFYDLCGDIQAKNEQIKNNEAALKYTNGEEKEKVRGSILALQNSKVALVQKYNADAANDYTKGQFRSDELPYHIDPEDKEIECGA